MKVLKQNFSHACVVFAMGLASLAPVAMAQAQEAAGNTVAQAGAGTLIPKQLRFTGLALNRTGDVVEATFRIYGAAQGGEPLWVETQRVSIGTDGKYSVLLGGATAEGLPPAVFAGGEARWVGVSLERAPEGTRSALVSVPYAMKAADSETLGGMPAGQYVTQAQLGATAQALQASTDLIKIHPELNPSGGGTANSIARWVNATTLGNSAITELGTTSPLVGVNTLTPVTTLDVNGASTFRSSVNIPPATAATSSLAVNSPILKLGASSYNSTLAKAVTNSFGWEAIGAGNNTAAPYANLNLYYSNAGAAPVWTGLSIGSTGLVKFAPGQTFPSTGTLTGITTTSPLTGSGTSGSVAVGLNVPVLETALNGVYPQLGAANSFLATQSITGGLTMTGNNSVGGTETVQGLGTYVSGITLPTVAATAALPGTSPNLTMEATGFNSSSATSVAQNFALSAVTTGNNTTTPSAKLEVLFGAGASAPTATGLAIYHNGVIGFAPGQTFPGVGTITGITTTSPLTGSGTTGSVALGINTPALVTAITPGIESTLNGVYAQLGAPNTFAANQTVNGNVEANGIIGSTVEATTGFYLGTYLFDSGIPSLGDSFLGLAVSPVATGSNLLSAGVSALSSDTTGADNTAVGPFTLGSDQDGSQNTAVGSFALYGNVGGCGNPPPPPPSAPRMTRMTGKTLHANNACANPEGIDNTAVGYDALYNNITGNLNTAIGAGAGPDLGSTGLIGSTAIGANSVVSQDYSLILGQTTVNSPGATYAQVGIGTAAPIGTMDIEVSVPGDLGPTLTLGNSNHSGGNKASIDFNTTVPTTGLLSNYNPGARIQAEDTDYSDNISFYSNVPGALNSGLRRNMTIYSNGNVNITGSLSKGGGSFKIDHPLDPANKYLYHSFVESPDMMNIYNGLVTLDAKGRATVDMPDWFESLNRDFRYQLTAVGAPGPSLYIAKEIENNQFKIAGGKAGMKVSWQVTGIRQDAWANAHRIPVEEDKPENERGYYLHPDLYGASEDRQVGNAPGNKPSGDKKQ